jgi:hypothetical protein
MVMKTRFQNNKHFCTGEWADNEKIGKRSYRINVFQANYTGIWEKIQFKVEIFETFPSINQIELFNKDLQKAISLRKQLEARAGIPYTKRVEFKI